MNLIESNEHHETQFFRWDRQVHGSFLSSRNRRVVLERFYPTTVVHLAWAPTGMSNYQHASSNTEWCSATQEFIQECMEHGTWVIATGSAVDGQRSSSTSTPYSEAKRKLRAYAESCIRSGVRITWVRPQYVVSLADSRPSVVRASLLAKGGSPFAPRNPDEALDFIEVRDVATAFRTILYENLMGQVYVGSGRLHTVRELLTAASARRDSIRPALSTDIAVPSPESPATLLAHGWAPTHTESLFGGNLD